MEETKKKKQHSERNSEAKEPSDGDGDGGNGDRTEMGFCTLIVVVWGAESRKVGLANALVSIRKERISPRAMTSLPQAQPPIICVVFMALLSGLLHCQCSSCVIVFAAGITQRRVVGT
ncbi:hypothetical protein TorRG33x02_333660 [Trema orientale]|uniref:Uncharacterized protein n=1 Tax=Trema orientale TaxID=63057 RepID=A0A2P5B400_TREOI|nr:hypothetical protein TorRG33x02_333660 [Trema orientale]